MHLSETTWTDADAAETDLALLPTGSTEQHGPHAPMGTDALSAETIAADAADAYDGEVVVAPPVNVGISEEHRHFTGSLWVSEDTFRSYVGETIESLGSHGWERIVVVNGHGGNTDALREVCGAITRDGDAYAVPWTWFDALEFDGYGVELGHGGPAETAVVEAVRPDLVHEDRFGDAAAGAGDGFGQFHRGTNLAYDFAEFSDSGNVGDPGDGDAELGERLLADATAALVDLLGTIADRDLSRPVHR
ncbi:Creatinine amidohydrolase/Fe(II)-dependent formamide hydrolase involved in riboflavin and F420 biosynthesis [Halapricum desulfuricans]|uniref:Creatinine amidohydrolase/Fe(II)-dependent formamide hydrolase involved in riboflavin and F420 biosynthesis n=1 Tax=Halapricum desulfuricans TaxID=2841257 RepID=A0A897NHM1_9EURY|nr:creatininase family protein [Halapricum desulfuricans]QSG12078.1 Creatinine amidohydrolase/Fe(II)-dependent formamide hydrolase involved in riboflavin and F420 biosynthesis [Halapricum desulfuricans]